MHAHFINPLNACFAAWYDHPCSRPIDFAHDDPINTIFILSSSNHHKEQDEDFVTSQLPNEDEEFSIIHMKSLRQGFYSTMEMTSTTSDADEHRWKVVSVKCQNLRTP